MKRIASIILILLLPSLARAQFSIDGESVPTSVATASAGSATLTSPNFTASAGDTANMCVTIHANQAVTSVLESGAATCNGSANWTNKATASIKTATNPTNMDLEVWYCPNTSAGTHAPTVTTTGTPNMALGVQDLAGVVAAATDVGATKSHNADADIDWTASATLGAVRSEIVINCGAGDIAGTLGSLNVSDATNQAASPTTVPSLRVASRVSGKATLFAPCTGGTWQGSQGGGNTGFLSVCASYKGSQQPVAVSQAAAGAIFSGPNTGDTSDAYLLQDVTGANNVCNRLTIADSSAIMVAPTAACAGGIATYTITSGGTGYSVGNNQPLSATGGQPGLGSGAQINVTSAPGGVISASTISVPGEGYAVNDTGVVSAGNGDATYKVTAVNPAGSCSLVLGPTTWNAGGGSKAIFLCKNCMADAKVTYGTTNSNMGGWADAITPSSCVLDGTPVDTTGTTGAATTISGAQTLPESTITVAANGTTGFTSSGALEVASSFVRYTGKTSNTFTGCTGGNAAVVNGAAVQQLGVSGTISGVHTGDLLLYDFADTETNTVAGSCGNASCGNSYYAPLQTIVGTGGFGTGINACLCSYPITANSNTITESGGSGTVTLPYAFGAVAVSAALPGPPGLSLQGPLRINGPTNVQ